MPRSPTIEIIESTKVSSTAGSKYFYFRVRAANGELVATSEFYTTKRKCLSTAKRLPDILGDAIIVDLNAEAIQQRAKKVRKR